MADKPRCQCWTDFGLLMMRVMVATVFLFHGSQKLFSWFGGHGLQGMAGFLEKLSVPLPTVSATLAGCAEFFGGLLVLLGLATRLAVVPMVFTMGVAVFVAHDPTIFDSQKGGVEYPLTLGVILIGLGFTGPGRMSLDALVGPKVWRKTRATTPTDSETV